MSKNLPSVTSQIPRDLRNFVDRLRDIVNGGGANKLVSAQDLVDAGIANLTASGGITTPSAQNVVYGTPPAPTGVTATAAINTVIVTWDDPSYSGHAYAEVWGASTDSIGSAVLLGITPGAVYSDPLGPGAVRYYWVRFVNVNYEAGAFNAVAGTRAETGADVDYLLSVLAGKITETQLYTDLNTRLNGIETNATAISNEAITRSNADGSINAKYTVKIDNAGHVSGFGLISTANNAAPTSTFGVRANQFFVAPPAQYQSSPPTAGLYKGYVWVDTSVTPNITKYYTGAAWTTTPQALPFVVDGSGVYMDSVFIKDATITNAKIANLAVDDAKISDLTATKLTTGSISVGNTISSSNYLAGTRGWLINGDGNAELSNAVVRGTVYASAGQFTGEVISQGTGGNKARMYSGNFEIYKDVPNVGTVLYKALSRTETGVGQNNVQVTIPGYFTAQPKIIVSPADIKLYDSAYANQSQSIQCEAQNISETSAGSMVWRFTPRATLSLAANTGQTVINQSSGAQTGGWTSSQYTTAANTSSVTLNVTLASNRGTGTSGNYYYRTVRWKAQYWNGSAWVDSAWSTTNLGADVSASATTSITVTFPSAGTWTVRVVTEAYDTNGTSFNTGTSYEYATDTVSRNDYLYKTTSYGSVTLDYSGTYSLPSGWSIVSVSASYTYSWALGRGNFSSASIYGGGLSISYGTGQNDQTKVWSTNSVALVFTLSANPSSVPAEGAYATLSVSACTWTISRRRALTNSTTAANSFSLNYYNYSLSSAQVLAEGSLNWVALGE